jgi:CheY-like chemotaxis protein
MDDLTIIQGANMKMNKSSLTVLKNGLSHLSFYSALVVDDYGPAKKMLGASLSTLPQIGEIDYADSGEEALAKVKKKHYDLIFLDVTMPGLDGFETCERMREIKGYEITPIVMVTGDTDPVNNFKKLISGCTSYVTKPIQQEPFRKLNLQMLSWLEDYKAA